MYEVKYFLIHALSDIFYVYFIYQIHELLLMSIFLKNTHCLVVDLVMDAESIREYCCKKKKVTESFPFGNDTLAFKVKGKIFLLLSLKDEILKINAKYDPVYAIELRELYTAIQPGYHMNKKLWNTITLDSTISGKLILKIIDDSYNLVITALPKKQQDDL